MTRGQIYDEEMPFMLPDLKTEKDGREGCSLTSAKDTSSEMESSTSSPEYATTSSSNYMSATDVKPCFREDFCVRSGGGAIDNDIDTLDSAETFCVHTADSVGYVVVQPSQPSHPSHPSRSTSVENSLSLSTVFRSFDDESDSSSSVDDQLSVIPVLDEQLVDVEFICSPLEFRGQAVPLLENKTRVQPQPLRLTHRIEPSVFNYKKLEAKLWKVIVCTNRVQLNMYSSCDARMRFKFEIIGSFNVGTHSKYAGRYYAVRSYRTPFLSQADECLLFGSAVRPALTDNWRNYFRRLRRRMHVVNERTQAVLLRSYEWTVSVNGTQVGVMLGPQTVDNDLLTLVKDVFERKTRRHTGAVDIIQPEGSSFYFTRHRFVLYCSNMDHLPILCSRIEDRATGNLYSFFVYRSPVYESLVLPAAPPTSA